MRQRVGGGTGFGTIFVSGLWLFTGPVACVTHVFDNGVLYRVTSGRSNFAIFGTNGLCGLLLLFIDRLFGGKIVLGFNDDFIGWNGIYGTLRARVSLDGIG